MTEKKKINSIRKGKGFEREIANLLGKVTNTSFIRIPQSGGMATNRNLSNFVGDVIPIAVLEGNEKQSYTIECKSTAKVIDLNDLFSDKSLLYSFIEQSKEEGSKMPDKDDWFLFIKSKRRGIYCIMPYKGSRWIDNNSVKGIVLNWIQSFDGLCCGHFPHIAEFEIYKIK